MIVSYQNKEQLWSWTFDGIALTWFAESENKGEIQVHTSCPRGSNFLPYDMIAVTPQDMRCQVDESTMYLQAKKHMATFTRPAQDIVLPNRRDKQPFKLLVFSEGQQYLDYILFSALIIERTRST